ncbi:ParB/RepB/Spo0J family partition protein [Thermodesulfobacterium sp. TA1]|uniref:ParB/RepB/Spo0J family partition protein n=1 Tax=Thermodesulfobacterium sp. TA1 TaxID=2234087 RepID=UPI001231DA73|nr:ParB/RepB/Spo0J family partition protein [Thermodesulfobacterium sp. TA1]QER41834.1 ParB/RepB/Spo0J family partition protein [Thermodesulfobacterium sp. TA1]
MKRKALGKGLSELIPDIDQEISLQEKPSYGGIRFIPIDQILFSQLQPRLVYKEDEEFEELVKSIKEKGVLQPILVREKGEGLFECIAGERRLRASKKAGLTEVPAIVKNLSDEEVLIVALIENLQRKNLNPLEEAIAYKNLAEKFGYTQEEIAAKVGKDRATIANLLRLLNLPQEIQQDLLEERLTVGHAKALLSLSSKEQQLTVRNLILQKGLSVRETERLVNKLLAEKKPEKVKQPDPNLLYLSEEISKLIGTKVNVKVQKKKTYFIFEFDEIERVEDFIEGLKKAFGNY